MSQARAVAAHLGRLGAPMASKVGYGYVVTTEPDGSVVVAWRGGRFSAERMPWAARRLRERGHVVEVRGTTLHLQGVVGSGA